MFLKLLKASYYNQGVFNVQSQENSLRILKLTKKKFRLNKNFLKNNFIVFISSKRY
jgi:hypothetical protein